MQKPIHNYTDLQTHLEAAQIYRYTVYMLIFTLIVFITIPRVETPFILNLNIIRLYYVSLIAIIK